MPKDITFIESLGLYELAHKLRERYYLYLGHIDLDLIFFAEKLGEKSKKAKIADLSGVSNPWVRALMAKQSNSQKLYCMSVWAAEWAELSPAQQEWTVFNMLSAVSPQEGKILKPNVQGFGHILEYFMNEGIGPYWEEHDDLPALLGSDVLPIPLPKDNSDEGSTLEESN